MKNTYFLFSLLAGLGFGSAYADAPTRQIEGDPAWLAETQCTRGLDPMQCALEKAAKERLRQGSVVVEDEKEGGYEFLCKERDCSSNERRFRVIPTPEFAREAWRLLAE